MVAGTLSNDGTLMMLQQSIALIEPSVDELGVLVLRYDIGVYCLLWGLGVCVCVGGGGGGAWGQEGGELQHRPMQCIKAKAYTIQN